MKRIDPQQVICLASERNYTRIILSDKTFYLVRSTLSRTVKKLSLEMFIKIHRSLVASIYYIDDITKDHLIIGGEPIPIGRQYYKSFNHQLNIIE